MMKMRAPKAVTTEASVTRWMTRRSMAGFGTLATLALGSLAIFWLQTLSIESGALVLNVSGRQRMLSQRTALLAHGFVATRDTQMRRQLREDLRDAARLMEASHHGLVHGNAVTRLPEDAPDTVRAIYFGPPHELDRQVQEYLTAIETLAATAEPSVTDPSFRYISTTAVEGTLLHSLDAVVSAFQAHEESQVIRLQRAKLAVFALTLFVIFLMRGRVVEPMVMSVRQYIQALHRQHEHLAHVTRLSTMGEMAAGIAHEINQPLSASMTYAQVLRRSIAAGKCPPKEQDSLEECLATLDKIIGQVERAGQVIQRVRSLTEQRESQNEITELNSLVQEAVKLAEIDARQRGITVHTELAPHLPLVKVDPIQIQQVLINLVRNALEALEAAGKDDAVIVETSLLGPDIVAVTVLDRGIGISDSLYKKLFEPFFTTKSSGMGMGLSISRSIVENHGGQLKFAPNPDGGSIFNFTLPVAGTTP